MKDQLIYCQHWQLKIHPQNIRLYYPDEDVAEMAGSIKAQGGVLQALLVTPIPNEPGRYYVIDGNMRLAGGRRLGDSCPPLKCEVIEATRAQQLLMMLTTTRFHYPKDKISEARHYRRLMAEEGLSAADIAGSVGLSDSTIYNTLKVLELDDDIQTLIGQGCKNLADAQVIRALLKIPDSVIRINLARRFARNGTSVKVILANCKYALNQYHQLNETEPETPKPARRQKPRSARPAAADIRAYIWELAGKTLCQDCKLDGLGQACYTCPGPYDFIQHLVELAETQQAQSGELPALNGQQLKL